MRQGSELLLVEPQQRKPGLHVSVLVYGSWCLRKLHMPRLEQLKQLKELDNASLLRLKQAGVETVEQLLLLNPQQLSALWQSSPTKSARDGKQLLARLFTHIQAHYGGTFHAGPELERQQELSPFSTGCERYCRRPCFRTLLNAARKY